MKNILVLGLGNTLCADDGVGVYAARSLARKVLPSSVTVMEVGTSLHTITPIVTGYRTILLLDAIRAGLPPGSIRLFAEKHLEAHPIKAFSLHEINLVAEIKAIRSITDTDGVLFGLGMEPFNLTEWQPNLSPRIAARMQDYVGRALSIIRALADKQRM